MLKMKKAVVKCTGIDMPELDLPMYKSPNRVVHALLESAQDLEQMKMLKAFQQLSQSHQQSNNQQQPQGIQNGPYIPIRKHRKPKIKQQIRNDGTYDEDIHE